MWWWIPDNYLVTSDQLFRVIQSRSVRGSDNCNPQMLYNLLFYAVTLMYSPLKNENFPHFRVLLIAGFDFNWPPQTNWTRRGSYSSDTHLWCSWPMVSIVMFHLQLAPCPSHSVLVGEYSWKYQCCNNIQIVSLYSILFLIHSQLETCKKDSESGQQS